MTKQVLFLCTANYYRSRFAEHLFNWLAQREGLPWCADSRGLNVDGWGDIGAISRFTMNALHERGIPVNGNHRYPQTLTQEDLDQSHLVVAVKEAEHRRLMAEQFPHWADRVEYWHIHDIDCATPDDTIPVLEQHVHALVQRLAPRTATRRTVTKPREKERSDELTETILARRLAAASDQSVGRGLLRVRLPDLPPRASRESAGSAGAAGGVAVDPRRLPLGPGPAGEVRRAARSTVPP